LAVAGAFALLASVAWLASSGVSVAIACYGAFLVSERMCRIGRSRTSRRYRFLALLGLTLTWLTVLAFIASVLPSNLSWAAATSVFPSWSGSTLSAQADRCRRCG